MMTSRWVLFGEMLAVFVVTAAGCSRHGTNPAASRNSPVFPVHWDATKDKGAGFYGMVVFPQEEVRVLPDHEGCLSIKPPEGRALKVRILLVNGTGERIFAADDANFHSTPLSWSWRVGPGDNGLIDQGYQGPLAPPDRLPFALLSFRDRATFSTEWNMDGQDTESFFYEFPISRLPGMDHVDLEINFPFQYYVLGATSSSSISISKTIRIIFSSNTST